MGDDNKVHSLHSIEGSQDDLRAAVEAFRRNLEAYTEYQRLAAQIQREKYNELVRLGFTRKEALELVKDII